MGWGLTPLAEMQAAYSTAQANWAVVSPSRKEDVNFFKLQKGIKFVIINVADYST